MVIHPCNCDCGATVLDSTGQALSFLAAADAAADLAMSGTLARDDRASLLDPGAVPHYTLAYQAARAALNDGAGMAEARRAAELALLLGTTGAEVA